MPKSIGYRQKVYLARLAVIGCWVATASDCIGATIFSNDSSGSQVSQTSFSASAQPVITAQPQNQISTTGVSTGFSVSASSTTPLSYQWQFNGSPIIGATGDSLLISNVTASSEGAYTVVVSNAQGSVTSTPAQLYFDSNGNGLPDSWEMQHFGNLNQYSGTSFAGDGIPNLVKFINGLDPSVYLPFHWIAATGNFSDPTNWDNQRYRAPGSGDTAFIQTGSFTVGPVVRIAQLTVSVPFAVPTYTDFTLNVTDSATFSGSFALAAGRTFTLDGSYVVSVSGAANLSGGSIILDGQGNKLSFTGPTTCLTPADTNVQMHVGNNDELDLPALASITGPVRSQQNGQYGLTIRADDGGIINLGALISIIEPTPTIPVDTIFNGNNFVSLIAHNTGRINAPFLSTFHDQLAGIVNGSNNGPASLLNADDEGVLSLPDLVAPVGIQIDVNALSHPEKFTSLVGTTAFTMEGDGTVSMALSDISGLTSLSVRPSDDNASKLTFPNVTSYSAPTDTDIEWHTSNNSELDFPALTTITGPIRNQPSDQYGLTIRADDGGVINLNALTSITQPTPTIPVNTIVNGNNFVSLITHNTGQINAPLLSTFHDQLSGIVNGSNNGPASLLNADDDGVLSLPDLVAPVGIQIDMNAPSHPEKFISLVGTTSFIMEGDGVVSMALNNINGFTEISVRPSDENASKLTFPNVTSYVAPADTNVEWHTSNNSELDFPALTTITGPVRNQPSDQYGLTIRADDGGVINLNALTSITQPTPTIPVNTIVNGNNFVSLIAHNTGQINAPLLSAFHDQLVGTLNGSNNGPASSLSSDDNGSFSLPNLFQSEVLGVTINGVTLSASQSFGQWEALYFNTQQLSDSSISGPMASPQHDSTANLLKYLFNINPSRPMTALDRSALPKVDIMTRNSTSYLTLSYRQFGPVTGITANVQTSADLKTWQTANPPDISEQSGTDGVSGDPIVTVGVKTNGVAHLYIRLNITLP